MDPLRHTLFFDIETAPLQGCLEDLPSGLQEHWAKKAASIMRLKDGDTLDAGGAFQDKAGVYAEFARVVCIGFACFHEEGGELQLRLKAIYGQDEAAILNEFCETVSSLASQKWKKPVRLCGHNAREFDVPFLCRRMVVHSMSLPECLQVQGKKPWELKHIDDTMELWKYGDTKSFTSLALLAEVLGIPSPKDDITGAEVGQVFWKDGDLERIARYCLKDVVTTVQVFLRLTGHKDIPVNPVYAQPALAWVRPEASAS
jgi:hypothetical protein